MRRAAGAVLVLIGAGFIVSGVLTPIIGEIDLDTSGKIYVGFMYAAIGLVFLWPGVLLLRRRAR